MSGIDLSHWQVTLNGAEVNRPSTIRDFQARFAPNGLQPNVLYPCYGLAESTVFVTGNLRGSEPLIRPFSRRGLQAHRVEPPHNPDDIQELVSVGKPYADTRIAIVDPETLQVCAQEQIGEVWIQGSSVGQGYWQQADATSELFLASIPDQDGTWLRSGDLGFCESGWLFITGRIKDLIILQGQNYAPQTFEAMAEAAHPAVRTGCVAAFGDGDPEGLVLLVEIKPDANVPLIEIEQAIRQAVSEGAGVPVKDFKGVIKASLPKTSSGKLRRRACKELYLSGKLKTWKPR